MSMIKESKALKENEFGVHDTFSYGLINVKDQLTASHPLENREKNYAKIEEQNQMALLRASQGSFAPFILKREREIASHIGRLPCLKSSNFMLNVLKGTDETLEIQDILNNQREFAEHNIDPHGLLLAKDKWN